MSVLTSLSLDTTIFLKHELRLNTILLQLSYLWSTSTFPPKKCPVIETFLSCGSFVSTSHILPLIMITFNESWGSADAINLLS